MDALQLPILRKSTHASSAPTSTLAHTLQVAERELEERSGVGSASSEGRDVLSGSKQNESKLERASNQSNGTSSDSSSCTVNSLRVCGRGDSTNHVQDSPLAKSEHDDKQAGSRSGHGRRSHGTGSLHGSHHSGGGSSGLIGSATGSLKDSSSSIAHRDKQRCNLEAKDASASCSSENTGSGSQSRHSGRNSTAYASMTSAQQFFMEDTIEDLGTEVRFELEAMQKLFNDRAINNDDELAGLWSRITDLTKEEKNKDDLIELLATARLATSEAEDSRDDLKDQIAGLFARIEYREEVQLKRVLADQQKAGRVAVLVKSENNVELEDIKQRLDATSLELNESQLQDNEQKMELSHQRDAKIKFEIELERVSELYSTTERAIARRSHLRTSDGQCDDFGEAHLAEIDLTTARNMHRELHAELAAQRLELLQMTKDHTDQLSAMNARLYMDECRENLHGRETPRTIRKTGKQKGGKSAYQAFQGKGKLVAIEEEFDAEDVHSNSGSAISGVVSSEGLGVGDMADFDDYSGVIATPENPREQSPGVVDEATTERLNAHIVDLLQQLKDSSALNRQLTDDNSNMDAEHLSKVSRMAAQLKWLRSEQYAKSDTLAAQRVLNASDRNDQSGDIFKEKEKLEEMIAMHEVNLAAWAETLQENAVTQNSDLERLHQELNFAVESKRIESGRVADTKRELEQVQLRHQRMVEDLNARLNLSQPLRSQSSEIATCDHLVDRLRKLEHKRNVMKNEGDIMKVELQAQLEQEQLQHAVTFKNLENVRGDTCQERQLVEDYRRHLQYQQDDLQGILRDCDERVKLQSTETQALSESQHRSRVPFDWLWCPPRFSRNKIEEARTVNHINSLAASISAAIWQVVETLQGVVALQCGVEELHIMEASRKAFEIWGSPSLRGGSSILRNLVSDQRSADWLQQDIASRVRASAKFWINQVGCVEFQGNDGVVFDAVIIAIYLPCEPAHKDKASIVFIVEPMDEHKLTGKWGESSVGSSQSRQRRVINDSGAYCGHDVSSTNSSEIGPNDSVSNIC